MLLLLNILSVALLILGFGFVIFWHELGHFLAAKAVGIKVEQFAVGMGHAVLSWRKGLGFTVGSSAEKYRSLIATEFEKRKGAQTELRDADKADFPSATTELAIAKSLGLGETEYRLNWLPLGGYVKMLGQDDLDFSARESDPRAYTSKPISARMLVVSAGVIMNIILAAILFMVVFTIGFKTQPPLIGQLAINSPAQRAGLLPGDRILSLNGNAIADFNKLQLNVVLLPEGATVPLKVLRDGKELTLDITPEKVPATGGVLQVGVGPTPALRGLKPGTELARKQPDLSTLPDLLALKNDEVVTAINGRPIEPEVRNRFDVPSQFTKLIDALDAADGKPVPITVRSPDGTSREIAVRPFFPHAFGAELDIAGIVPRPMIDDVNERSSALGKILPGDVVTAVEFDLTHDLVPIDSATRLREVLTTAGKSGQQFSVHLERNGQPIVAEGIVAAIDVGEGKKGVGLSPRPDGASNIIGSVLPNTPAANAGLTPNSRILSVNGRPISNLFEFRRALLNAGPGAIEVVTAPVSSAATSPAASETRTLQLTEQDLRPIAAARPITFLAFDDRIEPRKTDNPLTAVKWGVSETRDILIQGYVTLKRIAQGSVPASMANGPVGIFHIGGLIATQRTIDWIFWFLAMISANLAVVNFLPIPIVDGGLFLFLILEKVMGRPLSPKTQQIIQLAGLALIASVFLFVTYNDIMRLVT